MILADTSVWIDHLRTGKAGLDALLNAGQVSAHPFVIGELACGNLHNRSDVLRLSKNLPPAPVASHEEVLFFIENNDLMGRGIGLVDAHLLASAVMKEASRVWTHDKRLRKLAAELGVAYQT